MGSARDYVPVERQSAWGRFTFDVGAQFTNALWFPRRIRVSGTENIPREGAFILAPNHVSYLDPPVVGAPIRRIRRVSFMAKAELFRIPFLGWLIHTWAFPVQRGAADRAAIRTAIRVLEQGSGLVMFPEGGRAPNEEALRPGELGVAMVAARAGAPVIPVGVVGVTRSLPGRFPWFLPRGFEVRYGAPLELPMLREGRPRKAELEEATQCIMGAIAELTGKPHPGVAGTESAVWPQGMDPSVAGED